MDGPDLQYDILALSGAKRGGITTMSVLSFVTLELQTTHLDPASVSQASYVKLVNGNLTLVDSWPVIPPTASGDAVNESAQQTKTWGEAVSQLTMMVGTLPVVSYYRDADKEVFQAASQHVGKTPPEFHWLDCRELAKNIFLTYQSFNSPPFCKPWACLMNMAIAILSSRPARSLWSLPADTT
ncbi:MAG: hypothetical protein L0K44_03625 [Yaniella sp.]|nr:hypothetical protein [Yaniella sp.]